MKHKKQNLETTRQRKRTKETNTGTNKEPEKEKSNDKTLKRKKKQKKKRKKRNVMRISTWNIRTMLEVGKMMEINKELERCKIDIAALQEVRWKKQGQIDKSDFSILYSGENKQGQKGVAFMVRGKTRRNIIDFKAINGRMAYLRMRAKPFNISLINVYAPTEQAEEEDKEKVYEDIEEMMQKIPKHDTTLILGDFNAQIGKEECWKEVAGKHTVHEKTNDNGQRLCNMAAANGMVIVSTKYQHRREHKITWKIPGKNDGNQIDHILITKQRTSSIKDVKTNRNASTDTDHYMVTAVLRQKTAKTPKSVHQKKWEIRNIMEVTTRRKYIEALETTIQKNKKQDEIGDRKAEKQKNNKDEEIEDDWRHIKQCINNAAEQQIGKVQKKTKNGWWTEECQRIVGKKNEERKRWLNTGKTEDKKKYDEMRRISKKVVRESKEKWIDSEMKKIEEEGKNKNSKKFYQMINKYKNKEQTTVNCIKNKKGQTMETEEQVKTAWKEHFTELLTVSENSEPRIMREIESIKREETEETKEPTKDEVMQVIKNSKNGKSPGDDGINMEMIKYGGEAIQEEIYKLIKKVWAQEKMPEDWEKGVIIPIHKKGDRTKCENYRGITLLNTVYKILTTIIQRRLANIKGLIGDYQYGFVKGKSTVDAIHMLKQTIEKGNEFNIGLEIMFIDFKQAFDSIKRTQLINVLKERNIPAKLVRLIAMTMNKTWAKVKTKTGDTEEFEINKGVRQGDALSATLFNVMLEHITRKINKGNIRNRGAQIIAYADDIVIIAKQRKILETMLEQIKNEGQTIGLQINKTKTKHMKIGKKETKEMVKIGQDEYESVENFKYLGVTICRTGDRYTEIIEKIQQVNRAYYANKTLFNNKQVTKKNKIKMYRTLLRPILTYASEAMTLTKEGEKMILIQERKMIRKMLGGINIGNGIHRRRTNEEVKKDLNGEDVLAYVKSQRVRWLGHIYRKKPEEDVRALTEWNPGGRRKRGRPKTKWIEEVEEDLRKVGIKGDWKKLTSNRKKWKEITQKVKEMGLIHPTRI